jgi:hypothetical protein
VFRVAIAARRACNAGNQGSAQVDAAARTLLLGGVPELSEYFLELGDKQLLRATVLAPPTIFSLEPPLRLIE